MLINGENSVRWQLTIRYQGFLIVSCHLTEFSPFMSMKKARFRAFILVLFLFIIHLFIYFCLCWVFIAVCVFSLQLRRAGTTLRCGEWASHCGGFSCCGAWALGAWASVVVARGLSSCGTRAQLLRDMWNLPGPGLEPMSPALAGGFLTTVPPGKPVTPDFQPRIKAVLFRQQNNHLNGACA